MREKLHPVRFGLLLGALAVVYGFGLGVFFGAWEDWLQERNERVAWANLEVYRARAAGKPDSEAATEAAIQSTLDNAWRYWLRAHFHAGGIGSVTLGLSLVLALLPGVRPALKTGVTLLLGFGAVGYPLFWMLAGIRAPSLGSTQAASESLAWLARPTAGAVLVGSAAALVLIGRELLRRGSGPPD